jgi:cytochrome c5
MRHVIVTRVVVLLAALFVGAVALFTWAATRPRAPESVEAVGTEEAGERRSGAELFSRHCASCHDETIGASYRDAADRDAAAAAFREFLVDHYGPSPAGNVRIVRYLLEEDAAGR